MSREPEARPAAPARSGMPVKPAVGPEKVVPLDWLDDPRLAEQAARIDRLAADFDLITTLGLEGFQGPDWDVFEGELAKYGLAVIGGWTRRGAIFGKYFERGFGGLPEPFRDFTDDEVDELALETVAKGLYHFQRDVLMKQRWDYRKGASLRTYFVGQCLSRFANVYRRWYKNEQRNRYVTTNDDQLLVHLGPRSNDTAGRAVDGVEGQRALQTVKDKRVEMAMRLTAADRSQAEIAGILGVTEKAVERMLSNERQRQRRRAAG